MNLARALYEHTGGRFASIQAAQDRIRDWAESAHVDELRAREATRPLSHAVEVVDPKPGPCRRCNGEGLIYHYPDLRHLFDRIDRCTTCNGRGRVECQSCHDVLNHIDGKCPRDIERAENAA